MCVREITTGEGTGEDRVRNVRERCRLGERRGTSWLRQSAAIPIYQQDGVIEAGSATGRHHRGARHPARNTVWTVENARRTERRIH